jgi:hypothetical protein
MRAALGRPWFDPNHRRRVNHDDFCGLLQRFFVFHQEARPGPRTVPLEAYMFRRLGGGKA